jgi:hypothetical protein
MTPSSVIVCQLGEILGRVEEGQVLFFAGHKQKARPDTYFPMLSCAESYKAEESPERPLRW